MPRPAESEAIEALREYRRLSDALRDTRTRRDALTAQVEQLETETRAARKALDAAISAE